MLEHTRVSFALLPIRTRILHGLATLSTVDWRKEFSIGLPKAEHCNRVVGEGFFKERAWIWNWGVILGSRVPGFGLGLSQARQDVVDVGICMVNVNVKRLEWRMMVGNRV